ncbi:MAG: class I SAM-dependent methyltransferase [Acidimicrobiales bacterium]
MPPALRRLIETAAKNAVAGHPALRQAARWVQEETALLLGEDIYAGSYFGEGRDPLDRMGLSGYERYDRATSNADVAAYVLWRFLAGNDALDVGGAVGHVVEALRELGVAARGCDVSRWAIEHCAPGARGQMFVADITARLPSGAASVDMVSAFETLEHLPPRLVPHAVSELARVARHYVLATIPSFGPNPNGPGGWFQVKVRDEVGDFYRSLGPGYLGPVPYADLYRDASGAPIEGHLTIASFSWWARRFEQAGLVRCDATERAIHPHLTRFGLTKYWNLYVFKKPSSPDPPLTPRPVAELAAVEARFGLDARKAAPDDLDALEEALGPEARAAAARSPAQA